MRRLLVALLVMGCVPASKLGGSFDCTPDASVRVGCSETIGRRCSGRPVMSLCDGMISHEECLPTTASPPLLVVSPAGDCPSRTVTCPASGTIAVGISQGGSGGYTCTWDHQP